ncbi:XdhC family protein [Cohnella yongneupensis]|uniref:XdhC family protein n=1 Tax=Cohnella yongneupensis TaxID=425006 RepID=A0ABW0R796_9BACL
MDHYDILMHARDRADVAVLATLLHVEGHAYRKQGAAMLLLSGGGRLGSLSPGCLETDLAERAEVLTRSGRSEIIVYNLRPEEDAIWGEAIGCGGKLTILLEPLAGPLRRLLSNACNEVEAGREATLVRYASANPRLIDGEAIKYALMTSGRDAAYANMLQATGWKRLFSAAYAPRPRVIVFGADDGTVPLCELAAKSGFRVAVGDWRPELSDPARYPNAICETGTPAQLAERLAIDRNDYIVICSHHIRRDREMLELALAIHPVYLGVMGSTTRIKHLFEGLSIPSWVCAPVGLRIGADGPNQIAVSIVAELISARSAASKAQGGIDDGLRRHLFSGGEQQEDGYAQAVPNACPW